MNINFRKYFEYSFFIILNILLIVPVYIKLYLLAAIFAYDIVLNVFRVSEDIILYDDPSFIIILCCFGLSLTILKTIVLQIIYIFGEKLHYIHAFFDKLRNNKKFLKKILLFSFIVDISFTFISKNIFPLFFGLLFNYLIFLLFFHFEESTKINNDRISKIMVFAISGIIVLIFIFPLILFLIFILLDILAKVLNLY